MCLMLTSVTLFSCKVNSVSNAQKKTEKIQQETAKKDNNELKKKYKRHLSVQDKATRKRMKKRNKKLKKSQKIPMKHRSKVSCRNQQI